MIAAAMTKLSTSELGDGWVAVMQAILAMQAFVLSGLHDPRVRTACEFIVHGAPGGNRLREAERIFDFTGERVDYRRDPSWMEHIADPRLLLARIEAHGWAAEDCDGHATLEALLGFQVRLPMTFVLAGPCADEPPVHVYAAMWERPGAAPSLEWQRGDDEAPSGLISMDTARPGARFGVHCPNVCRWVLPAVA